MSSLQEDIELAITSKDGMLAMLISETLRINGLNYLQVADVFTQVGNITLADYEDLLNT